MYSEVGNLIRIVGVQSLYFSVAVKHLYMGLAFAVKFQILVMPYYLAFFSFVGSLLCHNFYSVLWLLLDYILLIPDALELVKQPITLLYLIGYNFRLSSCTCSQHMIWLLILIFINLFGTNLMFSLKNKKTPYSCSLFATSAVDIFHAMQRMLIG